MSLLTGAAIIGGSLIAGSFASSAAGKVAKAQTESTEAAIAAQEQQFATTREDLRPSLEAGNLAREEQQALLGLSGTEAQETAFAGFEVSPGQQFLRDRAQKNLVRNASAIGGLGGGNVRSALVQQGVGFAQQDLENRFGRLGQLAGQGQAAATSTGQFGQTTAGNIGNALIAGGNATASGIANQNTAFQTGLEGVLTGIGQFGGSQVNPAVGSGIQNRPTGFQQ